jgi:DNA (cytosine-5)-methyltransferase 1
MEGRIIKHASLFSGIGGFDLAAQWMGWDNLFHCEIDKTCQQILQYYWPNAKTYTDVKTTDFTIWRGRINVLTGGFPCQPYSAAGKRKGKEDERHLWPEMLRAIREIQPTWVVGENVLGLTNWNGGLVFEEVCADLEAEGYEVQPYVLPAAGINAPHRRDRVWFVAHSNNNGYKTKRKEEREPNQVQVKNREAMVSWELNRTSISPTATNTNLTRFETLKTQKPKLGQKDRAETFSGNSFEPVHTELWWENFPTQPPICSGDDGLPRELDGITFPKWRQESIKQYGNAVVPGIPFRIFQAIEMYESNNH